MILKKLRINAWAGGDTNCYIIADEKKKEAMVVDPAGDVDTIEAMLDVLDSKLKYIYLTHCHGDHIAGTQELKNRKGGTVIIHRIDAEGLANQDVILTDYIGMDPIHLEADSRIDDGDLIHVGNIEFRAIHTPGHTKGSSCMYCEEYQLLFSGDTLFKGTWGRTDLPTSSFEDIIHSITQKLLILPEDTIVYPGHGKPTRIKDEEPLYYNLKPPVE